MYPAPVGRDGTHTLRPRSARPVPRRPLISAQTVRASRRGAGSWTSQAGRRCQEAGHPTRRTLVLNAIIGEHAPRTSGRIAREQARRDVVSRRRQLAGPPPTAGPGGLPRPTDPSGQQTWRRRHPRAAADGEATAGRMHATSAASPSGRGRIEALRSDIQHVATAHIEAKRPCDVTAGRAARGATGSGGPSPASGWVWPPQAGRGLATGPLARRGMTRAAGGRC
jgi:hypothetical protein